MYNSIKIATQCTLYNVHCLKVISIFVNRINIDMEFNIVTRTCKPISNANDYDFLEKPIDSHCFPVQLTHSSYFLHYTLYCVCVCVCCSASTSTRIDSVFQIEIDLIDVCFVFGFFCYYRMLCSSIFFVCSPY